MREEVRRDLGDIGGAIGVEVEIRFGSGAAIAVLIIAYGWQLSTLALA